MHVIQTLVQCQCSTISRIVSEKMITKIVKKKNIYWNGTFITDSSFDHRYMYICINKLLVYVKYYAVHNKFKMHMSGELKKYQFINIAYYAVYLLYIAVYVKRK